MTKWRHLAPHFTSFEQGPGLLNMFGHRNIRLNYGQKQSKLQTSNQTIYMFKATHPSLSSPHSYLQPSQLSPSPPWHARARAHAIGHLDLLGPTQRRGLAVEDDVGGLEGNIAEDLKCNMRVRIIAEYGERGGF